MKLLHRITEDEVIAEFIRAEIQSKRFRQTLLTALGGTDIRIVTEPDWANEADNRYRRALLGEVRGFGRNKDLFEGFPSQVDWYRAVFTRTDLQAVHYIDYSYWQELSNHSRLPEDAAKNIRNDVRVFDVDNQGFREIQAEIGRGVVFPSLIFVACGEGSKIVVLEGHARLTAYFLDPSYLPEELEVMIGLSPAFADWNLY